MKYPRRVDVSLTGAFYEQFRGEFPRGLEIIPAPVVKAGLYNVLPAKVSLLCKSNQRQYLEVSLWLDGNSVLVRNERVGSRGERRCVKSQFHAPRAYERAAVTAIFERENLSVSERKHTLLDLEFSRLL